MKILNLVLLFLYLTISINAQPPASGEKTKSKQDILYDFYMNWEFCDEYGNLIPSTDYATDGGFADVCYGGTVYVKNTSVYNGNVPIPNSLSQDYPNGYYYVYHVNNGGACMAGQPYEIVIHPDPAGILNGIPTEDFKYGDVYPIDLSTHDYCFSPNVLNFKIGYSGGGVSPVYPQANSKTLRLMTHQVNLDAGPDQDVCSNSGQVQLNATGAQLYSWNPVNSVDNPNISNPYTNIDATTVFTLTGTKTFNNTHNTLDYPITCSSTDQVEVELLNGPIVNSNDGFICSGSGSWGPGVTFDAGPNGISYTWNFMNQTVGNSQTLVPSSGYGPYNVTVIGENGCHTNATFNLGKVDPIFQASAITLNNVYFELTDYNPTDYIEDPTESHIWNIAELDYDGNFISWVANGYGEQYTSINLPLGTTYRVGHLIATDNGCITNKHRVFTITQFGEVIENNYSKSNGADPKSYSPIEYNIYPNPSKNISHFSIQLNEKEKIRIVINDLLGKTVFVKDFGYQNVGIHTFDIDVSNFKSGIYIFNATIGDNLISKKVSVSN